MRDEEKLSHDLNELAEALSGLTPHESRLSRDRLIYEAGRAAALRETSTIPTRLASRWAWPAATAVSTLAATVLGVLLALPGESQVIERVVYIEAAGLSANSAATNRENSGEVYATPWRGTDRLRSLRLVMEVGDGPVRNSLEWRDLLLAQGIDALPERTLTDVGPMLPSSPATRQELMQRLLRESGGLRRPGNADQQRPINGPTGQASPISHIPV